MVLGSTEDTLAWARSRVPSLLSRIDDPQLLAILGQKTDEPDLQDGGCEPLQEFRPGCAFRTGEAFELLPDSWSRVADLYREDILRGRLLVASDCEPRLRSSMHVAIILPGDAGSLRLRAEVVHVSRTGFGLKLASLTGELSFLFESLIDRAGEAGPDSGWVEVVRRGLRARLRGADARVLGLAPDATPDAIQDAYTRARSTWEFFLGDGELTAKLRPVLQEYGSLLGRVCARLVVPKATARQPSGPAGVPRPRPAIPTMPKTPKSRRVVAIPTRAPSIPVAATMQAAEPSRAVVRNARRFMARLAPRPRVRAEEPTTRVSAPRGLGRVYAHIANRDYDAAESLLCDTLRRDPQNDRAQQLLHLVRARRAVKARDFRSAKRIYEALLRRDPQNEAAQKELIMISALA